MKNYDYEIERKYHPENFEEEYDLDEDMGEFSFSEFERDMWVCVKCRKILPEKPEIACPRCGEIIENGNY